MSRHTIRVGIYLDERTYEIYQELQKQDGFNMSYEVRRLLKRKSTEIHV